MMRSVVHFAAGIRKLMKRIDRVRGSCRRRRYIYIIDVLIDVSSTVCATLHQRNKKKMSKKIVDGAQPHLDSIHRMKCV